MGIADGDRRWGQKMGTEDKDRRSLQRKINFVSFGFDFFFQLKYLNIPSWHSVYKLKNICVIFPLFFKVKIFNYSYHIQN